MLVCSCGADVFEEVNPIQIKENNFIVWSAKDKIREFTQTISIVRCLGCDKLHIPSCSFSGRNRMDPEVKAYESLIKIVENYNKSLEPFRLEPLQEIPGKVFTLQFPSLEEFNEMKDVIKDLKNKIAKIEKLNESTRISDKKVSGKGSK